MIKIVKVFIKNQVILVLYAKPGIIYKKVFVYNVKAMVQKHKDVINVIQMMELHVYYVIQVFIWIWIRFVTVINTQ